MSIATAYSKMSGRDSVEDVSKDDADKILLENELKQWLALQKTKELLLFLAQRELQLLNNARNCVKVKLGNENTDKNLLKSVAYREVIDYLIENKQPTTEN